MKITANMLVSTEYELFVDGENENDQLELMEKTTKDQPMTYIHGIGMMLQKFEDELFGLQTGDSYEFTIPMEDAYGNYEEENVFDLDRSIFEINGKLDDEIVFPGNTVPLMDTEGNRLNSIVLEVTDSYVKVDLNHPLAGENLHFKGKVLEVREATSKEIEEIMGGGSGCCGCGCGDDHDDHHGHNHGHNHGQGGCGSDCGCN